jgi:hypothetical protein
LRIARTTGTGTLATGGKLRVVRTTGTGTLALVVIPLPDRTLEPAIDMSVTAALVGGTVPDSWAWRLVSGPATLIAGTGATVTITTPSHILGTAVTIGVRATLGTELSNEDLFTWTVLPQTEWWWNGAGWDPKVEVFA